MNGELEIQTNKSALLAGTEGSFMLGEIIGGKITPVVQHWQ